jgi:hypothetical protein
MGGREQFGGRIVGSTGDDATSPPSARAGEEAAARRGRLASLFDEAIADLLAASCLSRRTLERVLHDAHEPLPETWEALETALRLLDPSNPEGIAGWREALSVEALAEVLGISPRTAQDRLRGRATWTAQDRLRGRATWTVEERTRLVQHMRAHRMQDSDIDAQ